MRLRVLIGLLMMVVLACDKRPKEETEIYGVVNGRYITGEVVKSRLNLTVDQLKNLSLDEKKQIFEKITDEFLIEYAANKAGISTEDLLSFFDYINPKQAHPLEQSEYRKNNPDIKRISKEELNRSIASKRVKKAKSIYQRELKARSTVKSFLEGTKTEL